MTNEEMAVKLTDVDGRCRSNTHRLDTLEKNQEALTELTTSVKVLAVDQANLKGDVGEIKSDVKTLMEKPGKRWEFVVEKVIYVIVAAVIGYFLARAGMGD